MKFSQLTGALMVPQLLLEGKTMSCGCGETEISSLSIKSRSWDCICISSLF